jgi:hypothetical protein
LAIDESSCGGPACGTLARPRRPRRAAPRGARRNGGGLGGLDDRGPNGSGRRSDLHRAASWRVCGATDRFRALGPWPLTCDGRQLHAAAIRSRLTAMGARSHPRADRTSGSRALRSSFKGASAGSASRPCSASLRPARERRPPASPALSMISCLRARFGGPDARTRQIRNTEPSARPSYGHESALASWRCPFLRYRPVWGWRHIPAQIARAFSNRDSRALNRD